MREIHDVIIVGTGIAGLSAAIFLKEAGLDVIVITKESDTSETSTNYAQGGIIAWKKSDKPEHLAEDILNAGYNYNNREAVDFFVSKGPELVINFFVKKLGLDFSHNIQGEFDYTGEAAHSLKRILHYADHTGDKIQEVLTNYTKQLNIPIYTDHTAIDLITNNHHSNDKQELYRPLEVMGIYVLDNLKGEVITFLANKTILATGGLGNLYQHTTNPSAATGDGLSMAHRTGADIINAEFVQFHPTLLYNKDIERFLISESLRGEGAKLTDHEGHLFMENYPPLKDLAPRDVVARAIFEEMNRQDKPYMLLDLKSHYKGDMSIKERFSKIYHTCLKGGIDITQESIPVVPAAHYFCGGIKVDLAGRSSLKNLYAIGETSCTGLHGANRLASSSLLEGLLWAKSSADDIIENFQPIITRRLQSIPDWIQPANSIDFDPILINQDWKLIQLTMWNYVGIVRMKKGLDRARADINYYSHHIMKFYKEAVLTREIIELRNAVVNASIIINSAIHNKTSIGCHYIED